MIRNENEYLDARSRLDEQQNLINAQKEKLNAELQTLKAQHNEQDQAAQDRFAPHALHGDGWLNPWTVETAGEARAELTLDRPSQSSVDGVG